MNAISRFAPSAARLLLGLVFFVFGLNGFLQFIPPPPAPDKAVAFLGALAATGYMFPLIKSVEVIGGALLLSNRFVPLALAVVAPNVVNIVLFHAVLAPGGLPVALFVLGLELFAAWSYRSAYASMLRARTAPKVSGTDAPVIAHAAS
ncbi:MAG: DoxX family membrane protein [Polyangiaceae bacterium]